MYKNARITLDFEEKLDGEFTKNTIVEWKRKVVV